MFWEEPKRQEKNSEREHSHYSQRKITSTKGISSLDIVLFFHWCWKAGGKLRYHIWSDILEEYIEEVNFQYFNDISPTTASLSHYPFADCRYRFWVAKLLYNCTFKFSTSKYVLNLKWRWANNIENYFIPYYLQGYILPWRFLRGLILYGSMEIWNRLCFNVGIQIILKRRGTKNLESSFKPNK